jgi:Tol biopolymer transport system component
MRKDGRRLHRLTNSSAYDEYPDVSPNGRKMVFDRTVDMGNQMIFISRIDGTHAKRLTSPSVPSANPRFSPSGKKIVFSSARDAGGNFEVFVMRADGSRQHRLMPTTSSSYPTGWGIRP